MGRWSESWKIFRRCLKDEDYRLRAARLDKRGEAEAAGAVRIVSRLQEEGRLVDFLLEEIAGYSDAHVGAAARSIHDRCRAALTACIELSPVLPGREGSTVTVPAGFDPLAVKLEGNLGAQPPFRGVLRHPGWRAAAVHFPAESRDRGGDLIAPAEVEVA